MLDVPAEEGAASAYARLKIGPQVGTSWLDPLGGTLTGQAFRSGHSVVLDRPSLAGLPFASAQRGVELGVKSLYLSPLGSTKGPVGVLKVAF